MNIFIYETVCIWAIQRPEDTIFKYAGMFAVLFTKFPVEIQKATFGVQINVAQMNE